MNSLKSKTIKGLIWTFSDVVLNQGIQFIIQIFLARLILPEEFGLIGMITVFIAVSNSIIDSGFSNALIRDDKTTDEDYSTIFYFNLITSIILYLILYTISPIIGSFFNQGKLSSILRVLAITLIINSFGIIQRTMLIKKINFKVQMNINILSSTLSGILAIILAYKGFGVWSLVFRTLIMQLVQSIMLSIYNRWKPKFVFSIKSFKKLFGFGWKLLISGLIDTLYNNIYYLVIGKIYSTTSLGYYTNAQKLRDVVATSISSSVQKVTFPVLSSIQSQEEKLKDIYRKIIKNSVYITFPVMIGIATIAKSLILILFGENWINCVSYFQILCLAGMLYPLHAINLNILQVKGRSDLYLKIELIKKFISVGIIVVVIILKLGILSLIWVSLLNSIISFFINSFYSKDIIGYSTKDQVKDIYVILLISTFMGVITYNIGILINVSNISKLIIQSVFGIGIYILLSYIFKLDEFYNILNILKSITENIINFRKSD